MLLLKNCLKKFPETVIKKKKKKKALTIRKVEFLRCFLLFYWT